MEEIKTIKLTFVNAFLIKVKDGFVLIDTGLPMHWEKLESELISAGCLPDKLKLVIVTHGDFDHAGNCLKLRKKYGVGIAMHKEDAPMVVEGMIRKRKMKSFRSKLFSIIRRLFRKKFTFEKFTPDILLTDGQQLDEYGLYATVLHLPGHTKGSIAILTDEGNLFAGDIFTNRQQPDTASYIEDQAELDNSLSRLKNMHIHVIYPGHGRPFEFEKILGKL